MTAELMPPGTHRSRALDDLLEIYRRHGFDAGYHQAVRDQMEVLVPLAEQVLARGDATPGQRRLLYGFVASLTAQLSRRSPLLSGSDGFTAGEGI